MSTARRPIADIAQVTGLEDALGDKVDSDSPTLCTDATNHRVGIGTATPAQKLHVVDGNIEVTVQDVSGNESGIRGIMVDKASTHPFFSGIGYLVDGTEKWSNGIDYQNDDYVVAWSATANGDVIRLDPHGRVHIGEAIGTPTSTVRLEVTAEAGECVLSLIKDPTNDSQPMLQLADGTNTFRATINSEYDYISMGLTSNTPWYFQNGGSTRFSLLGTGEFVVGSTYGTGAQMRVVGNSSNRIADFLNSSDGVVFQIPQTGSIEHALDIIPTTTNARALGSSTRGYKELYLHDGTDEWKVTVNTSGTLVTTKV